MFDEIKIKEKRKEDVAFDCVRAPPPPPFIVLLLYYSNPSTIPFLSLSLCLVDLSCFLCHVREARSMFFGLPFFPSLSLSWSLSRPRLVIFWGSSFFHPIVCTWTSARFQDGHKLYIYLDMHNRLRAHTYINYISMYSRVASQIDELLLIPCLFFFYFYTFQNISLAFFSSFQKAQSEFAYLIFQQTSRDFLRRSLLHESLAKDGAVCEQVAWRNAKTNGTAERERETPRINICAHK